MLANKNDFSAMKNRLNRVSIVLLNTFHPGNIGAVARAMKTMGLSNLILVNPVDHPSLQAESRAAGAKDVLQNASIVDSLPTALSDFTQVFATTARQQHSFSRPINDCESACQWIVDHPDNKVAILFGCERSGLSASDLEHCQQIIHIPGNPEYDVLNLASAVQIVCYELFKQLSQATPPSTETKAVKESNSSVKMPTQQEINHFYQHLEKELVSSGYIRPQQPTDTMKRFKQFFNRSKPSALEVSMMRGIIKSLSGLRTGKK
ncbi:RNA methyltransferase [Aliikangiella sp. IMCC44653]